MNPDEIMSVPISFSASEANILLAFIDAAVKSLGLQAAGNAVFLANKIKSAFPQAEAEPAKEAA